MQPNRRVILAGIASLATVRVMAATPRDAREFGVAYDDTTDSFAAMQKAIDWASQTGNPIQLSGPLRISDTLRYRSNLTLVGTNAAQIRGLQLDVGKPLLDAPRRSSQGGTDAASKNLTLRNIRFLGAGNETRGALVRVISADTVVVDRCVFRDHRCIMLSLFGVSNGGVTHCEFTNWGAVGVMPPGPALQMVADPTNRACENIDVADNNFHDGACVAVSVYGRDISVRRNRISNTQEGAIFAFRDRPGDQTSDAAVNLTITDNIISNVVKKDVSATGIEIGADGALVRGNRISNTESSGILILPPSARTIVTDNDVTDTVQRPDFFREHGQIQIIAEPITPDWPQQISITKNRISSSEPERLRAPYAIAVRIPNGNPPPISGLVIRDNQLSGGYVKQPVWIDRRLVGSDADIRNNG
jgi:hypothetical protein